jgi:hypothetical protein
MLKYSELLFNGLFLSYIMWEQVTFRCDDDDADVCFVLDQHA